MQTTNTPAGTAAGAPATQPAQEIRKHRKALFRGRTLFGLAAVMLALFGLLTVVVLTLDPLTLDVPITRELQEMTFGPLDALLIAVSAPGFFPWNYIFPLAIIAGLALFRRFGEAVFVGLAALVSGSDEIVKALVQRARPNPDLVHVFKNLPSYSFPSGHVAEYTLVFGFCFYLAFTLLKPGVWRTLGLVFCAAMVLLVGPSRVWMGQHWASDALGGYTLGFGLLLLVIWAYRAWEAHNLARQPAN